MRKRLVLSYNGVRLWRWNKKDSNGLGHYGHGSGVATLEYWLQALTVDGVVGHMMIALTATKNERYLIQCAKLLAR